MYLSDKAHSIVSVTLATGQYLAGTGARYSADGLSQSHSAFSCRLQNHDVVLQDIYEPCITVPDLLQPGGLLDSASALTPTQRVYDASPTPVLTSTKLGR
jgi:hypothetical protein